MPTHVGTQTKQATFLNIESHKLHLEFEAGAVISIAQPVKLNATGQVVPLAAGDPAYISIGSSIHDAAAIGDLVTIIMRAHAVITAQSAGAVAPGPASWSAFDAATKRQVYVAAAGADDATKAAVTQAFILEPAGAAGEEIEVALI